MLIIKIPHLSMISHLKEPALYVASIVLFLFATPDQLRGDDGKEVKIDFRGAFYAGDFPVAESATGVATALNALRFGPANSWKTEQPRKETFKKTTARLKPHTRKDFLGWLKSETSKHATIPIDLPKFSAIDFDISSTTDLIVPHRNIYRSLLLDTPIILALDTYVVECKSIDNCYWVLKQRRFVLATRVEPLRQDKKSISLLILNPLEPDADLVDALIVYRKGNPKNSSTTPTIDFHKPFPTIHGSKIDNQIRDSWAQRSVTIPVWMIGRFTDN